MNEHFIFHPHKAGAGTYPEWTTPDVATPVMSCAIQGTRQLLRHDDTGATMRSRKYKSQGAVKASGAIRLKGYPVGLLPWLFRLFLSDAAVAAAGATGYDNDLLPDDTLVQLGWLSIQKWYSSAVAENVRGAAPGRIRLSCKGGEELQVDADFTAADTSKGGGTWSGGAAAPDTLGAIPYPAAMPVPLRFHEGAIILGGTPEKVGKKLSVSAGTTVATIDTFELEIALNAEGVYAIRDGAPTIAYTRHGAREITWRGDIDFATPLVTYYDYMRAATEMSVRLDFVSDDEYESGHNYELHITLPRMVWPEDGAPLPAIDGSLAPKKQAIRLVSMMSAVVDTDLGVSIKTTDDLT
jgi:hypothetical protein